MEFLGFVALVFGLSFHFSQKESPDQENEDISPNNSLETKEQFSQNGSDDEAKGPNVSEENGSNSSSSDCGLLSKKLRSCEPFSYKSKSVLKNGNFQKEVVGLKDGGCNYYQDLPNNGSLECKYSESSRKAIANYHEDFPNVSSYGLSAQASPNKSGEQEINKTYTLNGKEVKNPLQKSIEIGECEIKGYGSSL